MSAKASNPGRLGALAVSEDRRMRDPRRPDRASASGARAAGSDDPARRTRARSQIESVAEPSRPLTTVAGRRLSEAERRAMHERRQARLPPVPASVEPPPLTTPKPVPRMPRSREAAPINSRPVIVLGAVLLAGLTVLAFAGGRLFGAAGDGSSPRDAAGGAPMVFPAPDASPEAAAVPLVLPTPTAIEAVRAPVVCLDPGHGGPDRGFTRFWSELAPALEEAVLTLEHAWDLEARLKQRGYTVVLTRRTDVAVNAAGVDVNVDGKTASDDPPRTDTFATLDELQSRINICNNANADLLVSMHVNGYTTSGPRGYETWYTRERSFGDRNVAFATLAYAHLKDQLGRIGYRLAASEERGVNPDTAADVQIDSSVYEHFIITGPPAPGKIVSSEMPGAIVEALFVSNDGDAAVLASPGGRAAIVTAYENAIVEYFERYPPA